MRRAAALALAASALAACGWLTGEFHLAGTVALAAPLGAAPAPKGTMLFIVAENEGGVPLAVHRIVDPDFPASFKMGPQDLLVPAVRRFERLKVHAEMSAHGDLGKPRPGDWEGDAPAAVRPGARDVAIVLEKIE